MDGEGETISFFRRSELTALKAALISYTGKTAFPTIFVASHHSGFISEFSFGVSVFSL